MAIKLIRGLYNIRPKHQGCIATIGNFDGVHLGHQMLLKSLLATAAEKAAPALLITFEPYPAEFFSPSPNKPARITRLREKLQALQAFPNLYVLVLRFNQSLANLTAEQFIEQILVQRLAIKHIIVGDDFHFGRQRMGNFALLAKAGSHYNFTAEAMASRRIDQERISSTSIRKALWQGDFSYVKQLLGRPYCIVGRIIHGDKIGRQLGFPTANLALKRLVSPLHGIYAVRVHNLNPQGLFGVASVGTRPTIGGQDWLLEVYLFNFNEDIYDKHIMVEFCQKLRDEKCFENNEQLTHQIALDVKAAASYFANVFAG